jgi:hypothetical protein
MADVKSRVETDLVILAQVVRVRLGMSFRKEETVMPTEQEVREALRPVTDPEIGMSVVDLGMIREVAIEGDGVEVKMVLTAPFCPLADFITETRCGTPWPPYLV